jgi:hypothetical protein
LLAGILSRACSYASAYEQAVEGALRELGEPSSSLPQIRPVGELFKRSWPDSVKVLKVVPRQLAEKNTDRLFKITGIDPRETFEGATGGIFGTAGVKYFGSLQRNHTLTFIPAQGWIHYKRAEAIDDKGNRSAVAPPESALLPRALELAEALGLSKQDFAKRPDTNDFEVRMGYTRQAAYKSEPRVVGREIFLRRAIGGHPVVTGHLYGGLSVGIGINGMLHHFELTARATQPEKALAIAPLSEQLNLLGGGKPVHIVHSPPDWLEATKDKNAVLELGLAEVVYFEDEPNKVQKIIPPILRWEGELKFRGATNLVVLFTSIAEARSEEKGKSKL